MRQRGGSMACMESYQTEIVTGLRMSRLLNENSPIEPLRLRQFSCEMMQDGALKQFFAS